jgi:hypothetical protein
MTEPGSQLMQLYNGYLRRVGWDRSLTSGPVDAEGKPLAWITYPALEVLKQIVNPSFRVFEFGCGNSSLWWAARAAKVVSVDHNENWIQHISAQKQENLTLIHRPAGAAPSVPPSPAISAAISIMIRDQVLSENETDNVVHGLNIRDFTGYATALTEWPQGYFDVIVVDGMARSLCAYLAGLWVKPHGLIVFDNSNRGQYSLGYEALRDLGFGRIDFVGPCPVNPNESCTSIFAKHMTPFLAVPKCDRWIHL